MSSKSPQEERTTNSNEQNHLDPFSQSETTSVGSEERDELRPLFDTNKKRKKRKKKFTYSNPNNEMLQRLEKQRSKKFMGRLFSPLKGGSLRAVVLFWVRMTTGIGIMSLPFYVKQLGMVVGLVLIILAGVLSYFSFKYIFESQYTSGKKDMVLIIKEYLPDWIGTIYSYTLIIDVLSVLTIYLVVSWNLLTYIMYFLKIAKPDWIKNHDTIEYYEYNKEVFIIRIIFIHIVYIILIPFLLKRSLEKLRFISNGFITILFLLIVVMLIQMGFFFNKYHYPNEEYKQTEVVIFKPFWKPEFFTFLYSVILSFYIQPFALTLRKELLVPSMTRLKKVARTSIGIEMFLFVVLGGVCYMTFGEDYTTPLIILRKPLEEYRGLEWVFKILIIGFFLFNTLGLPMYNVGLRDLICKKIHSIQMQRILSNIFYFHQKYNFNEI